LLRGVERRDAQRLNFSAREGWLLNEKRSRQPVPPYSMAERENGLVMPRATSAARNSMIVLIMAVTSLLLGKIQNVDS